MSKDDKDDKDRNKVVAGIEKTTEALAKAILDVVAAVPKTNERLASTPRERARAIQTAASLKAAAVSGTLALPSGPLSFAVILPDLISVWRIQAKMVADIAGASREQLASIDEVTRALARMEEVTQRNAALVQDSAQAASRMAGQSGALARAVAHFDTDGHSTGLQPDLDSLAPPAPVERRALLAG